MAKIMIKGLVRRGLIVETESNINPDTFFVSKSSLEYGQRMYLIGESFFKNGRRKGIRAEKMKDFAVVSSGRIISQYFVGGSKGYCYKCQGVLFLTSLEEALVQAGFDLDLFDAVC